MGAEIALPRRALSVEDYHRMGEAGLFAPEERLELIRGDLVTAIISPQLRSDVAISLGEVWLASAG